MGVLNDIGGTLVGAGAGALIGGPMGALVGGTIGGAYDQTRAADRAAAEEQAGLEKYIAELRRQYDQTRTDLEPFRDIELARAERANKLSEQYASELTGGESKFTASPGYQFRLSEAEKAVNRAASAQGFLNTPQQQKALYRYSQGLASQEYGDYMNRLAIGFGQPGLPATQSTVQTGADTSRAVGAGYADIGASRAGAIVNKSNAYSNMMNQLTGLGGMAFRYGQGAPGMGGGQ